MPSLPDTIVPLLSAHCVRLPVGAGAAGRARLRPLPPGAEPGPADPRWRPACGCCATWIRAGPRCLAWTRRSNGGRGLRIEVKVMGLRWLSLMWPVMIPWAGRVRALPFLTVLDYATGIALWYPLRPACCASALDAAADPGRGPGTDGPALQRAAHDCGLVPAPLAGGGHSRQCARIWAGNPALVGGPRHRPHHPPSCWASRPGHRGRPRPAYLRRRPGPRAAHPLDRQAPFFTVPTALNRKEPHP